jgi:hypothetical protein
LPAPASCRPSRQRNSNSTDWRILADCHKRRNLAVYEGSLNVDDRLLNDLIEITGRLLDAVEKLGPVAGTKPS